LFKSTEGSIVRIEGWKTMNKHIGVSKTIAWRPFIKRQTSRAKMKG
jgi:hypothetical protein